MGVGKVCKGTSAVLFIFDFIGSIVLGKGLGDYTFNWAVFLYSIIVGFIFCLLIYALGEIIDQLECSNSNTYELYQVLEKLVPEEDEQKPETQKSYIIPNTPRVIKTADGGWVCKKCNTTNENNTQFCKDCGTYK